MSQISTDDFWETTTQRIGALNGDLDSYDEDYNIFDEYGNVIPTTLPPTVCDDNEDCFQGFGDEAQDDDESEQVSLSGGFSRIYNGCLSVLFCERHLRLKRFGVFFAEESEGSNNWVRTHALTSYIKEWTDGKSCPNEGRKSIDGSEIQGDP